MTRAGIASGLDATVLFSVLAAAGVGVWALRGPETPLLPGRRRPVLAMVGHPLAQLVLVCVAIWINQLLFNAHVLRAHHGDPAFLKRWLGHGWCELAPNDPFVRFVAAHVGDGRWLSVTVLRVQAFLELPFTLFAYLAVARLLSRSLFQTLTRLPVLALASASFTATFCLVELNLRNPWTADDIVLRLVALAVVPIWTWWVARLGLRSAPPAEGDERPSGVLGLLSFLAGAGAIAIVVLAVYDAFLLYNLGHLPRYARGVAVALAVALLATIGTSRVDRLLASAWSKGRSPPSAVLAATSDALVVFTLLFFVPSLAIRYRALHAPAQLAGLAIVATATIVAFVRRRERGARVFVAAVGGIAIGAVLALFVLWKGIGADAVYAGELDLARAAIAFLAGAIVSSRAIEIALAPFGPLSPPARTEA